MQGYIVNRYAWNIEVPYGDSSIVVPPRAKSKLVNKKDIVKLPVGTDFISVEEVK